MEERGKDPQEMPSSQESLDSRESLESHASPSSSSAHATTDEAHPAVRERATQTQQQAPSDRRQRMERQKKRERRLGVLRTALLMVLALVVGVGIGIVVLPKTPIPAPVSGSKTLVSLPGKVSVTEEELNTPMGTYTVHGEETTVTVREAIEASMSLDAARNSDGTYDIPTADAVLSVARNKLLLADAEQRGISASDEDAKAYAKQEWGTDDYAVIAASYSMTADQAKELMRESATLKKLRDAVVESNAPTAVEEPKAPEEGKADEPTAEYGAYVTGLAADEWDAEANTWKGEDGPYYAELKNFTIANDAATHSAAQAAYQVALQQSAATEQQASTQWTSYVNGILSNVTVQLGTLVA